MFSWKALLVAAIFPWKELLAFVVWPAKAPDSGLLTSSPELAKKNSLFGGDPCTGALSGLAL
jgi:hypothetical protein